MGWSGTAIPWGLCLLWGSRLTMPSGRAACAEPQMEKTIARLAELLAPGAQVGVVAYRLRDGAEVVRHRAHAYFVPDSTLKLAAAATTLVGLGLGHRLTTELCGVWGPGTPGVVETLVLKGGGDLASRRGTW